MTPHELYKDGKLSEAIDAQIQEVKSKPADQARRLFLFELLAFAGELDRARKQIEAITYDQPELMIQLLAYRQLLDAETARRKLFQEGVPPLFLSKPPAHVQMRLDAVNLLREKKPREAAELLAHPDVARHDLKGMLNDKPFNSLRDGDDVFGTVLEVMSKGNYFWVPLEQIDALTSNAPKYPRDLIYLPAHLDVRNGPSGDVFLPALYPSSYENADPLVKLGRFTDWTGVDGEPVLGVGLRTFLVGDDAQSLLEWRQLEVFGDESAPPDEAAAEPEAAPPAAPEG